MKTVYPKVRVKRTLADADREIADLKRRVEELEARNNLQPPNTPGAPHPYSPIYPTFDQQTAPVWPWPYHVTCEGTA